MQQKQIWNATGVDSLKFAKKFHWASLKSEIDQLDIGKLETTPADLSTLSDVVRKWCYYKDCIWWIS